MDKNFHPLWSFMPILPTPGYITRIKGAALDQPLVSKPYRQKELCQKISQVMHPTG